MWNPPNVITLGPRYSNNINKMINITGFLYSSSIVESPHCDHFGT